MAFVHWVCATGAGVMAALFAAYGTLGHPVDEIAAAVSERTPGELVRYLERRLQGHDKLQWAAAPVLQLVRAQVERPVPSAAFPSLGKGQQAGALPPVRYGADGRPVAATATPSARVPAADLVAASADAILRALREARAGQVIEVLPGRYRIDRRAETRHAGSAEAPIVLRAARPGDVVIEFANLEGFIVSQPYWVFENLELRGACAQHADCEHAFHIVGRARGTVVRNNRLVDFNAHVKVNGAGGDWPDDGLLQFNSISNTAPRGSAMPATPVDIVAASRWQVVDNVVANFVKGQGNRISYGIFMKGAGRDGRIERNLVLCTPHDVSQPGQRVGVSMGGGGTGAAYCRDGRCEVEHADGVIANNVIAHCNDFGIDINRASGITVAHNTLINTAGIDLRHPPASAHIRANVLDGRIRTRDGAQADLGENRVAALPDLLQAPDALQLAWRHVPPAVAPSPAVPLDFCARPRRDPTSVGALGAAGDCRSP